MIKKIELYKDRGYDPLIRLIIEKQGEIIDEVNKNDLDITSNDIDEFDKIKSERDDRIIRKACEGYNRLKKHV